MYDSQTLRIAEELKVAGFPLFLTTKQVCQAINISRTTLMKLRDDGLLAASTVNENLRFLRVDVAAFMAKGMK